MLVTQFNLKYVLYKIVLAGFQLFDTGRMHPARARAIRALERSVDYIETHMPDAMGFETQKELLTYALNRATQPGYFLEMGVYTGGTMRFMAKRKPDKIFHGFDSFEGLPEMWGGFHLGRDAFDVKGKLPDVPANVKLHKGWFRDTLPAWSKSHDEKISFLHIDCDIYSSTVDILENLKSKLQEGTILVFDEYFNYPNWENHEFKAWHEFVETQKIEYEYIGFARQQAALRITRVG